MVHVVSLCMIDLLNRLCECIELLDCNQICVYIFRTILTPARHCSSVFDHTRMNVIMITLKC